MSSSNFYVPGPRFNLTRLQCGYVPSVAAVKIGMESMQNQVSLAQQVCCLPHMASARTEPDIENKKYGISLAQLQGGHSPPIALARTESMH